MLFSTTSSILCAIAYAGTTVLGLALPEPRHHRNARSFAGGILLRTEPLGASITHGVASSDGNGYRQILRNALIANGNSVDMVGSNPNGTMVDNDNSGWPGLIIDQVHDKSNVDTPTYKPNLVLINLGTNDAIQNVDIPNAGARMNNLLTDIYAQSPRATVVLSGVIRNADSAVQSRAVQINSQYVSLANSLQAAGRPIVWADMQGSDGPQLSDLSSDGIHPVDAGYAKMANIFYSAISVANQKGFLKPAE